MSEHVLLDYEGTLRSGGAPNPEVFTRALKGVLEREAKERSEMNAALADIKQTLVALDRRFDAVDRRFESLEQRLVSEIRDVRTTLAGEIATSRAQATAETNRMGLELITAMNGQLRWAVGLTAGFVGVTIAVIYAIERFAS